MNSKIIVQIMLLLCISTILASNHIMLAENMPIQNQENKTLSESIFINGNADLINQATTNGWDLGGERDGSIDAPFLIEDLLIETTNPIAIEVRNIDLSLRLDNITINGGGIVQTGVRFENVQNGFLFGSHIYNLMNNSIAVSITNCVYTRIIRNTIDGYPHYSAYRRGIEVINSPFSFIRVNSMYSIYNSIYLYSSNRSTVANNEIYDGFNIQIYVSHTHRASITENYILNGHTGIYLQNSQNNFVTSNSAINGSNQGIALFENSRFNNIYDNLLENNADVGLLIVDSHSTRTYLNTFTANHHGGIDVRLGSTSNRFSWNNLLSNPINQIYDENPDSNYQYNYFDNHTSPDVDLDGFSDNPYYFGVHVDSSPLNHTISYTMPFLIAPSRLDIVKDDFTIEWDPPVSNYQSLYTYTIRYKPFLSESYSNIIATDLVDTNYIWDVQDIPNGRYDLLVTSSFNNSFSISAVSSTFVIRNHELSTFEVIQPNGGEVISGQYNIQWTEPTDTEGHALFYDVSLSDDNGATWHMVVNSISLNSILYNFSSVEEGTAYLIQIRAYDNQGLNVFDTSDATFTVEHTHVEPPTSDTTDDQSTTSTSETISDDQTTTPDETTSSTDIINDENSSDNVSSPSVEIPWSTSIVILSVLITSVSYRRRRHSSDHEFV